MSLDALRTLLERCESERDQIAAALARAQDGARRAELQAQQLAAYRGEYGQRWQTRFTQGSAIEIVHCYGQFMGRLDDVIGQSHLQLDTARSQADRLRERLVAAELRVASTRKLIERREAERQRIEDRRDQRRTDETAQQLHWRQRARSR